MTEHKEIATRCRERAILGNAEADLLLLFAGYRNRMVHFYHEIPPEELFSISSSRLGDIEQVASAYRAWLKAHPDLLDETL